MEKARLKLQERVRSQEDLLCFLCLTSNWKLGNQLCFVPPISVTLAPPLASTLIQVSPLLLQRLNSLQTSCLWLQPLYFPWITRVFFLKCRPDLVKFCTYSLSVNFQCPRESVQITPAVLNVPQAYSPPCLCVYHGSFLTEYSIFFPLPPPLWPVSCWSLRIEPKYHFSGKTFQTPSHLDKCTCILLWHLNHFLAAY